MKRAWIVDTPSLQGLPKGVKFDPTDEEVIEHLEAKSGIDGLKPHLLIQDFISSVTDINYTHPQNLPGIKKDGASVFFFNKTTKAYTKGNKKRRKITPSCLADEGVCWNKTGRTKPVMLNGVQRGFKKVMVLYKSARKGTKSEKLNWVQHQYHLGTEEDENGEFVVSKIKYKQQQWEKTGDENESYLLSLPEDEILNEDTTIVLDAFAQGLDNIPEASFGSTSNVSAQVIGDMNVTEDNLICKKIKDSSSFVEKNPNHGNFDIGSENFSVLDLENADLVPLPDFLHLGFEGGLFNAKNTTPSPARPMIYVPEDEIAVEDTNIVLDPFVQGLKTNPEVSFGSTSDKKAHVAGELNVSKGNLICKNIEASSSFVDWNPNHGNFHIGSENVSVSDLENADLGTLFNFSSFAYEESY